MIPNHRCGITLQSFPILRIPNISISLFVVEDKKDIYIIILLADFDDDWRRNVTNKIKELYSDDVQEGTIQVLQSFSWMYPKLDNLAVTIPMVM
jgi:hypothetical protein